jgi:hypothetical protein
LGGTFARGPVVVGLKKWWFVFKERICVYEMRRCVHETHHSSLKTGVPFDQRVIRPSQRGVLFDKRVIRPSKRGVLFDQRVIRFYKRVIS